MLDGSRPVNVPLVADDQGLIHHNDLFAHLFDKLSKSQGMTALLINPSKNTSIASILGSTFPAIKSTNNLPTLYITPRTVAYIHAL